MSSAYLATLGGKQAAEARQRLRDAYTRQQERAVTANLQYEQQNKEDRDDIRYALEAGKDWITKPDIFEEWHTWLAGDPRRTLTAGRRGTLKRMLNAIRMRAEGTYDEAKAAASRSKHRYRKWSDKGPAKFVPAWAKDASLLPKKPPSANG